MLFALVLHLIAGLVTGSVFKIRTLLVVLCCVGGEVILASGMHGISFGLVQVANLVAVQIGYMAGMLVRGAIERSLGRTASARTRRAS